MTIDVAAHAKEVDEQGYTIVRDAIEVELLAALREDLARLERELEAKPANNLFEGRKTVRIYNLLARGKVWQEVPVHAHVLPIVEQVLDSGCLVSSLSSIAIEPGETPQPVHADDQLIPLKKPHAPIVCNSMWALTDFTEENGATRILPGSHRESRNPPYGEDLPMIPAVMPAGSVMVYNGSLWHGGGENRSAERRVGVAMNYCAGFIRQQENQQLGIPRELARTFSPRLRELCGYGVYSGLIGHIDKKNPVRLLDGDDGGYSAFDWDRDPTQG